MLRQTALRLAYKGVGRQSLQIMAELKENEKLSPDHIRALQFRKLKLLLDHVYHHVPFYQKRFKNLGISPEDIRSLEDYSKLPVLTRNDLKDHINEIVARNVDTRNLIYASTGGSTGTAVNYYHDRRYANEVSSGGMWRAWSWAGMEPGDLHFYLWGSPSETRDSERLRIRIKHLLLGRIFIDAFDMTEARLRWAAEAIQRKRPAFVYGYASGVTALAKYMLDNGVVAAGIGAAMTTAERLLPQQREIIERAFGCKSYDQYACREVRSVASECSKGKLHVNDDLNVVEFVHPSGAATDSIPMIALTPLELFGFPLLRYLNEDCGEPDTNCDCGLPFPTVKLNGGRISDNFTLPNGRIVHGEYFSHLLYGLKGIRKFQFHQIAQDLILLRIVADDRVAWDDAVVQINEMIEKAERSLGGSCTIRMERVERIPLTPSGKYRFTLSDVTHAATESTYVHD